MTLFSTKETCFKAWPPGTAVRGFRKIQVRLDEDGFLARVGTLQMRGRVFCIG